ncbi:MAG: carotenoid cleavage dioxygenase-like enzyme [Hyphomicrobiaceae bacterium]|jgi:carotenoid cleavage dioxygenase-like enzyme
MSTASPSTRTPSLFLAGNFAPVSEEHDAPSLEVEGSIPADLRGTFLRIGPNPQFIPDPAAYHWFDGDGMVHGVTFGDQGVSYRNRYVRTQGWQLENEAGRWLWRGVNSPPDFDNPHGAFKNVANTAFVQHAGRTLALWEGGKPHEIGVPDLFTIGVADFDGRIKHPFTAHPKVDPVSGEMMTFGYEVVGPPFCNYTVVDRLGNVVHSTVVNIPRAIMMHDFAITEHYTLFFDMPVTFSLDRALRGESAFAWEPEHGSRIGVLPRYGHTADMRWFEVETCSIIHGAAAYEDGNTIVVDAPRFQTQSVFGENDGGDGSDGSDELARMHRWRLDRDSGRVEEQADPGDLTIEFPRINEARVGRPNRYIYAGRQCEGGTSVRFDGVVKFDRERHETAVHSFGPQTFGGEAVFAPGADGRSEDDGWLVSFVHDEASEESRCVILDARDVEADPVATVRIPWRVPYGFHADWVAAK